MVNSAIHIADISKEWGEGMRSIGGYRDHTTTRSDATLVVSCDKYQCERYYTVACLGLRFWGTGWLVGTLLP